MRDAIESAYHSSEGYCLDAMYALRGYNGRDAIDCLKSAIRSVEHAQRLAAERSRRERARPVAACIPEPPPSPDF